MLATLCKPLLGGQFFHQRCACHVLNLCVQSGLDLLKVHIEPIRNAISYLWKHPQCMKSWVKYCLSVGKTPIRFSRDVPTRWNSTYKLLKQSEEYKKLLCDFMQYNVSNIIIYPSYWDVCTKICELLKVFNDATNVFSHVYKPTAHLFLIEAVNIVDEFHTHSNDSQIEACVDVMVNKWLSYYQNIPMIYLIAFVFDPRCKLEGIKDYLQVYYDCLGQNNFDVNRIHDDVKGVFYHLYEEYAKIYGINLDLHETPIERSSSLKISRGYAILANKRKKLPSSSSSSSSSSSMSSSPELDSYLTTSFEFVEDFSSFDILQWWKEHERHYPLLSLIAKQILATPVSTVAVEQEFSARKNVLDPKRSCLSPDSLEAQVLVEDWTKAKYKQQEMEYQQFEEELTYDIIDEHSDGNE